MKKRFPLKRQRMCVLLWNGSKLKKISTHLLTVLIKSVIFRIEQRKHKVPDGTLLFITEESL